MTTTESSGKTTGRRLLFYLGWLGVVPLLGGLFVLGCNLWVILSARDAIFEDPAEVKANDVGLVLGTSKNVGPNRVNLHFRNRVAAAADLYKEGKVRHLLVSGDNRTKYYNEPRDMKEALISLGVPKQAITGDFAGFRTFDSVVRADKVFGLKQFTIVSDGFHLPRAVFLARSQGLDTVALASREVDPRWSLKARSREWLARVKAVLDVYVFETEPKFLGEPVEIRIGHQARSGREEIVTLESTDKK